MVHDVCTQGVMKWKSGCLIGVLCVLFCGWAFAGSTQSSQFVVVHFIDVGQGDAILIDLFSEKYILIDSGPMEKVYSLFLHKRKKGLSRFLAKHQVNTLQYCILSHAHDDHISGLRRLIQSITIREVWDSGFAFPTKEYRKCLQLIEQKALVYKILRQGFAIDIDGVRLEVLSPKRILRNTRNDANNNSLVIKMTYQEVSFLFTGDIEFETEWRLLKLGKLLRSTILKVPHHGANTSSTQDFLRLVDPELAVISCGELNTFGHPSVETLETYQKLNIDVYRTDKHGTITIQTDGKDYQVLRDGTTNTYSRE